MSIKKYDIAKEWKRGIIKRIEYSSFNSNETSKEMIDGWNWAHRNLSKLIHDGLNEYLKEHGEEPMDVIKAL